MTNPFRQQIQDFYDASTELWEEVWGEHLHHGYYGDRNPRTLDRRQAQVDLIDRLVDWLEDSGNALPLSDQSQILDVGCGVGGSSLHLWQKFHCRATGITLSPVQAQRASERSQQAGANGSLGFLVADALAVPFADATFDWIWSLESGEHMPDKTRFLAECYRLLKPGGTLMLATWCHRPLDSGRLSAAEVDHLSQLYQIYHLPYVISLPDYEAIAEGVGFEHLQTADWSAAVAPFWDVVLESALDPKVMLGVLLSGWETIQGAFAINLMREGYKTGLIRYGVLSGRKPE